MKTKICKKCNTEKKLKDFYFNSTTKDNKDTSCKKCRDKQGKYLAYKKFRNSDFYILSLIKEQIDYGKEPIRLNKNNLPYRIKNAIELKRNQLKLKRLIHNRYEECEFDIKIYIELLEKFQSAGLELIREIEKYDKNNF